MKMFKVDDVMKAFRECKDPKDFMFKIYSEVKLIDAIPVSDNATNGDMIKAMFLDYKVQVNHICKEVSVYYDGTEEYTGSWFRFDLDWWNAPYKKGAEE